MCHVSMPYTTFRLFGDVKHLTKLNFEVSYVGGERVSDSLVLRLCLNDEGYVL